MDGIIFRPMSTGLQLAIDEILKVIGAKEAELYPLKMSANMLARQIPVPDPFPDIEAGASGPSRAKAAKLSWRIDQFFNKPLAGCVSDILVARRTAGFDGPATIDELFEDLKAGGFRFQGTTGSDENTKRAIKVALTKNTAQFVKIGDDTFGLKAWYGAARGRPKKSKASGGDSANWEAGLESEDSLEAEPEETHAEANSDEEETIDFEKLL